MSDQLQDTVLNNINDNFAEAFFKDGAASNNVMTPDKDAKPEVKPDEKIEVKLNEFSQDSIPSAFDLLGERFEGDNKEPKILDGKTVEPVEEKKVDPVSDYNFLIESKTLSPFEDDAPIKSPKELEELIKANRTSWEEEAATKAISDLEGSLPEEVKFLVDYAKTGGKDIKSIFKILSQTEEFKSYDVEKPEGQKALVRAYYATQGWSEEEIEDELVNLVESKRLKSHADKVKPKLEKLKQDELQERQEQQKDMEKEQEKARNFFTTNVVDAVKKGDLGGLKITKEEQHDIYNALVKESYQSFNGPTNRLGALLDRIQFVKPDYALLAKVTMYLSDPEGFEKKLKDGITTEIAVGNVKKIKTDQQQQKIGAQAAPPAESKKLPRLNSNFI